MLLSLTYELAHEISVLMIHVLIPLSNNLEGLGDL